MDSSNYYLLSIIATRSNFWGNLHQKIYRHFLCLFLLFGVIVSILQYPTVETVAVSKYNNLIDYCEKSFSGYEYHNCLRKVDGCPRSTGGRLCSPRILKAKEYMGLHIRVRSIFTSIIIILLLKSLKHSYKIFEKTIFPKSIGILILGIVYGFSFPFFYGPTSFWYQINQNNIFLYGLFIFFSFISLVIGGITYLYRKFSSTGNAAYFGYIFMYMMGLFIALYFILDYTIHNQ